MSKFDISAQHQVKPAPGPGIAGPNGIEGYLSAMGVGNRIGAQSINDTLRALTKKIPDPFLLRDMDKAVKRLRRALDEQQPIVIAGDYDADGATSTALMVRGLRALGGRVKFFVPDRQVHGYGLSPKVVDAALESLKPPIPPLFVTVDNGIVSHEGVAYAKTKGIDVIVTDHHECGADGRIPDAVAVVNPQRPDCSFPTKKIAGVGVAFFLILAMCRTLRAEGVNVPSPLSLLDLVAVGTIADVVPMNDEINYNLVEAGLQLIREGSASKGVSKLFASVLANDISSASADYTIGFQVGPRINAAGRLSDMSIGIKTLLASDDASADELIKQLSELNSSRKEIQADMLAEAEKQVKQPVPSVICVHSADWHEGVVGNVASRLKEAYHRPVFVFATAHTKPGQEQEFKASARSIEGINVKNLLDSLVARHPGVVVKYGGHAAAAGVSIRASRYDDFVMAANQIAREMAGEDVVFGRKTLVFHPVDINNVSFDLARRLRVAVWGNKVEAPTLCSLVEVHDDPVVRFRQSDKTPMTFINVRDPNSPSGPVYKAMFFGEELKVVRGQRIIIAYKLSLSIYQEQEQLTLMGSALVVADSPKGLEISRALGFRPPGQVKTFQAMMLLPDYESDKFNADVMDVSAI